MMATTKYDDDHDGNSYYQVALPICNSTHPNSKLNCSGLWMLVVCDLLLMAASSMFLANIRTVPLNTKLTVLLIMVLPMVPIWF